MAVSFSLFSWFKRCPLPPPEGSIAEAGIILLHALTRHAFEQNARNSARLPCVRSTQPVKCCEAVANSSRFLRDRGWTLRTRSQHIADVRGTRGIGVDHCFEIRCTQPCTHRESEDIDDLLGMRSQHVGPQ